MLCFFQTINVANNNQQYGFKDYDSYLCLKVSTGMWAVILFLFRPYVIIILSLVNRRDRMELINAVYTDRTGMMLGALAAIPVMVFIYAWIKRQPDASDHVRWIWHHGRGLLLLSAALNAGFIIATHLLSEATRFGFINSLQLLVCGVIFYYLLVSVRVNDTFADFPKELSDDSASNQ